MKNFFTPLAWLVMSCGIFTLTCALTFGQIIMALAVYKQGFQDWMLVLLFLPVLGAALVHQAWKEYKEDKQ